MNFFRNKLYTIDAENNLATYLKIVQPTYKTSIYMIRCLIACMLFTYSIKLYLSYLCKRTLMCNVILTLILNVPNFVDIYEISWTCCVIMKCFTGFFPILTNNVKWWCHGRAVWWVNFCWLPCVICLGSPAMVHHKPQLHVYIPWFWHSW